jgi:Haem-binding domain
MKTRTKWMIGGAAGAFLLLQLASPPRTNPPVVPGHDLFDTNPPPPEIAAMLRNACYDCHSSETKWPWYSHVAPVSLWLVDHIKDGRNDFNFSDWPHNDAKRARRRLNNLADEVRSGRMPLKSYTWIHSSSRLSSEQREQLATWAEQEADRLESQGEK